MTDKPNSSAASFRTFIEELVKENDLLSIMKEVDPHLELAAITRKVYETRDKASLFQCVKGRTEQASFVFLGHQSERASSLASVSSASQSRWGYRLHRVGEI
ncbi:uncharacterized protein BDZ83DRAFT_596015 [Colletotrichum acutatum]|uniref:3-octaprenyl-4-hydroxybenzoate carboxy-lyase-like N-terminal domain-containing protein n=1 Tax=Glomerella acutata TaxID=27357 RepID=A0AAD8U8M7_GLOAC|nr:uncharacterized protein BDZ83DRAFT_596015 [Colletotrichum acutatum]KAK1701607.1 hypothetical protein BDZ83DRAFT_596015 [Colletotrichum acutatum]